MSGSYRSGLPFCGIRCSSPYERGLIDPLKISLLLGRCALEPWPDVTGRKAIAHVPRAITWPPELRASCSFHARLNLGWKCNVGEHEGEEGEPKQRRHWPDPFRKGGAFGHGGLPRRLPGYALPSPGRRAHGLVAAGLVCKALRRCQLVSCTWRRDGESTNASDQCHCE